MLAVWFLALFISTPSQALMGAAEVAQCNQAKHSFETCNSGGGDCENQRSSCMDACNDINGSLWENEKDMMRSNYGYCSSMGSFTDANKSQCSMSLTALRGCDGNSCEGEYATCISDCQEVGDPIERQEYMNRCHASRTPVQPKKPKDDTDPLVTPEEDNSIAKNDDNKDENNDDKNDDENKDPVDTSQFDDTQQVSNEDFPPDSPFNFGGSGGGTGGGLSGFNNYGGFDSTGVDVNGGVGQHESVSAFGVGQSGSRSQVGAINPADDLDQFGLGQSRVARGEVGENQPPPPGNRAAGNLQPANLGNAAAANARGRRRGRRGARRSAITGELDKMKASTNRYGAAGKGSAVANNGALNAQTVANQRPGRRQIKKDDNGRRALARLFRRYNGMGADKDSRGKKGTYKSYDGQSSAGMVFANLSSERMWDLYDDRTPASKSAK